jgi:argininosuccinate synthase
LWHISFEGGVLENPNNAPKEDMFVLSKDPQKCSSKPEVVTLDFKNGIPVKLNGKALAPVEMIERLNIIAGRNGVGRVDMVENRLVGMKSRGVYETPAGTVLYAAHKELEMLVMDRDTYHYKLQVASKLGEMIYNGLWFTPLREAISAFISHTQTRVTGTVRLALCRGLITVMGRTSPNSLYWEELATFEADQVYNQRDAEGFINLYGLPIKVQALLSQKKK